MKSGYARCGFHASSITDGPIAPYASPTSASTATRCESCPIRQATYAIAATVAACTNTFPTREPHAAVPLNAEIGAIRKYAAGPG